MAGDAALHPQDAASGHERTYRGVGRGRGVRERLALTAHAAEAHLEALTTVRAMGIVRVVDILGFDFGTAISEPVMHVPGDWRRHSCCT